MKIKNNNFKLLILAFAFGFAFTGCNKDDDNSTPDDKPEDITIPIDYNSAFNMKNFIVSFDQLFTPDNRWAWSFKHDYVEGKAITSYTNYKVYGGFGDGIMETTHHYNSEGIITSSDRVRLFGDADKVSFTYEYNLDGFIVKLTKKVKGVTRDVVALQYDGSTLVKKNHNAIDDRRGASVETFTYNSDNKVLAYTRSREGRDTKHITYSYSNGNMVKNKNYSDGDLSSTIDFEYDNEGRIIKWSYDSENEGSTYDEYTKYEYSSDHMTESRYEKGDRLYSKTQYKKGFIEVKSWSYSYDEYDNFEYCMIKEHSGDGYQNVVKKSYKEGSVSNLELVGYATVDSRDSASSLKTKESVYNSNGTKVYYAVHTITYNAENDYYDISNTSWYKADGTPIDRSEITEYWVLVLVRER